VDELSETIVNIVTDVGEVLVHRFSGSLGVLELHSGELEERLVNSVGNDGPRNLLIALVRLSDGLLGALEELDDALHHADGLLKGAVVVVGREGILLEEVLTDDLGDFKNGLLILGEGVLTDKLHDFGQVLLLLKDLTHAGLHLHELRIILVEILLKNSVIVGIGNTPVD